ncbi:hypothetical protein [Rhodanobacter sp. OR87]|uniref:hypothetical protein n=1 Tax=Rhodanobacter sp. OR87 TaxID=1076523 RepID=UPI0009DD4EF2|nr:hypothetical protein [Rhodanobacter sp. OR87]
MSISEKLTLGPGETLRVDGSHSKGFMGEADVTNYSVLDASGNVVGTVEHIEHTAVKGFRVTNLVTQKDSQGKVLTSANW